MNVFVRQGLKCSQLLRASQPKTDKCIRFVVTALDSTEKTTPTIGSPTENKLKKIIFPPFVKDLFVGEFNKSILNYAEVLNYERYFVLLEQTGQLTKFLEENKETLKTINERGAVPEEILIKLKGLDLYGLMVPAEHGGADLLNTEVLRLFQELGVNLTLAELFTMNELMCTKAIVKQGSEAQKAAYLEKISTGELWTSYCISEPTCGSDPNQIQALARWDAETETYKLKGTKTWVSNAVRANLFLVFANLRMLNYLGESEDCLTAFLVEKNSPGVEVSMPYDLAGYNGLQVCDIQFDCSIPQSALLGEEGKGLDLLTELNHEVKYFAAAGLVTRLTGLLDETVKHTLHRKQYGAKLSEFELIQIQLAKCASKIYALESMLYITSGLADVGLNPDIETESAIVHQFAVESFDYVTKTCLSILGAQTNLKEGKYGEYLAENLALQTLHGTSNINKCFIALSGIKHLIKTKGEYLTKCRQPGFYPVKRFVYVIKRMRTNLDVFPLKYNLENYVHPRLLRISPLVDKAAHRLSYFAESLLMEEGLNAQINEANLERLSDIATDTFAMTCVLSRASRSYVVGHPHANHEISLAIPFIYEARQRVEQRFREKSYEFHNDGQRDLFYAEAGSYVVKRGAYSPVNPIIKNSV